MSWPPYLLLLGLCPLAGTTLLDATKHLLEESERHARRFRSPGTLGMEYDFVIVGGGTAGCVLGRRLSEVKEWKVLVLEAGGAEEFHMDMPVLVGGIKTADTDWQYHTEPSELYCTGYQGGRCRVPRGKVLGGSSVLNYMIATRGNAEDYDEWAALGNPGWAFQDVLPYFIKAENVTPGLRGPMRGKAGPLHITQLSYHSELAQSFLAAGKELGHRVVRDYNGESQTGFSYFQFTQRGGRRESSSRAFLLPVMDRDNLVVQLGALVTKMIIEGGQARGVEVEVDGKVKRVYANKEVILSAGAINSPQLLMLSGVGPKEHLEELGIHLVSDLQVGYNLQDHLSPGSLSFLTNSTTQDMQPRCIANHPKYMTDYVMHGEGPWQVPGGNEGIFLYDINSPNDPRGRPDIEIHFSISTPLPEEWVRGFKPEIMNALYVQYAANITFGMQPILMRPKSRGRLKLRSKDPRDKPVLVPNYLAAREDAAAMMQGVRKVLEISRTHAFARFNTRLNPNPVPGCEAHTFASDAYFECVLRVMTLTNYHQSGTCRMGPASDHMAVVDSELRVHGVQGLRVVDASIMPNIVSAHTNVPTTMIAERAADFIKAAHGQ